MKKIDLVFCLILLSSIYHQRVFASHEFGFGIDSSAYANRKLLGNLPLPITKSTAGTYKLTIQPAHISGDMNGSDSGTSSGTRSGDFDGIGGGLGFSYAFNEKWGAFVIGVGSKVDGTFKHNGCSNTGGGCIETSMSNSSVNSYSIATGATYNFDKWETSLLIGSFFSYTRFEQTVVQKTNSVVNADFDMAGNKLCHRRFKLTI